MARNDGPRNAIAKFVVHRCIAITDALAEASRACVQFYERPVFLSRSVVVLLSNHLLSHYGLLKSSARTNMITLALLVFACLNSA